jgi:hypothetical protein
MSKLIIPLGEFRRGLRWIKQLKDAKLDLRVQLEVEDKELILVGEDGYRVAVSRIGLVGGEELQPIRLPFSNLEKIVATARKPGSVFLSVEGTAPKPFTVVEADEEPGEPELLVARIETWDDIVRLPADAPMEFDWRSAFRFPRKERSLSVGLQVQYLRDAVSAASAIGADISRLFVGGERDPVVLIAHDWRPSVFEVAIMPVVVEEETSLLARYTT